MKKILLVTSYDLVRGMVTLSLPRPENFEIVVSGSALDALGVMQEEKFSAVILTELIPDNWQDLLLVEEDELSTMILFRVGLDESSEPFVPNVNVFASVHGRTLASDPNSLEAQLKKLLGE